LISPNQGVCRELFEIPHLNPPPSNSAGAAAAAPWIRTMESPGGRRRTRRQRSYHREDGWCRRIGGFGAIAPSRIGL